MLFCFARLILHVIRTYMVVFVYNAYTMIIYPVYFIRNAIYNNPQEPCNLFPRA